MSHFSNTAPCSPNVDKTTNSPKEYLNITNYIVYNLLGNKIFEGTQTTDNTIEIKNKLSYFPKGVYIITHFGENGEMLKSNKFINTK
ncbi:MAG: T9SS type A sorting domain-containing protein [Sphingobacteriales bacterium]|nr:T9SS type A sorting domain-containing protein [Sphingobacteriales bacterium]